MSDHTISHNRRELLKNAGSVGIGLSSIAGLSAATQNSDGEIPEVNTASSSEKEQVMSSIKEEGEVRKLITRFEEGKYELAFADGKYAKVIPERKDSYLVSFIPIKATEDNEEEDHETYLKWGNSPRIQTSVHTFEQESDDLIELAYYLDEGDVKFEKTRVTNQISRQSPPEYEDPGSGSCGTIDNQYCVNYNWSCISFTVAALGLSCGSGLLVCITGISLEVIATVTEDQCSICDEYHTEVISRCRF